MLATVNLNNKHFLAAGEINDIRPYRILPDEFIPADLSVSDHAPKGSLGIGRALT